ncbi:DUF2256 domain-containing protein [Ensifer sp. ENS09]|nr:DUF2256 domain-containing protein [Ensifer sp. ENS09]
MPRMIKKSDFPKKFCPACGLVFQWRLKWAKDWNGVRFCSERCRKSKRGSRLDLSDAQVGADSALGHEETAASKRSEDTFVSAPEGRPSKFTSPD